MTARNKPKSNDYWIVGPDAFIDVSTRKHPMEIAIVDAADIDHVIDGHGRWAAYESQNDQTLRVQRGSWTPEGKRTSRTLHRHVLRLTDGSIWGDHKDRDALNNRTSNLREATPLQNQGNRAKNRTSSVPYKGITRDRRRDCWYAQIHVRGKHIHLGRHDTPELAAAAYDAAAIKHFGEFARTNFAQQQSL